MVMLSVPDERTLHKVAARLALYEDVEWFREPDFGNALTAIAAAGPAAMRRLSRLPLLLREEVICGGGEHVVAAG
jgi:hypothetical protein